MGVLLERLVDPTLISTTAATVYTASSKTLVRSMDIAVVSAVATRNVWVMLNSLTVNYIFRYEVSTALDSVDHTTTWRGGLVLNTGDYLAVDTSIANTFYITINGATGLPSS